MPDTIAVVAASRSLADARSAVAGAELQIVWAVRVCGKDTLLPAPVRAALREYDAAVLAEREANAEMSRAAM